MATSNERPLRKRGGAPAGAAQPGSAAERYRDQAQQGSPNTRRAYAADLRSFEAYCVQHGKKPYPASLTTLSDYAAHLARFFKARAKGRRA